eukprot:11113675-Lingulodinium_polyedra.AAC.1
MGTQDGTNALKAGDTGEFKHLPDHQWIDEPARALSSEAPESDATGHETADASPRVCGLRRLPASELACAA